MGLIRSFARDLLGAQEKGEWPGSPVVHDKNWMIFTG
jgi:hypothetical protein